MHWMVRWTAASRYHAPRNAPGHVISSMPTIFFCQRVDAGEDTEIAPYAAEAPEEFFAVVSEYHFSAPHLLARAMPQVAAHLERFYGPSPFAASVQR